MCGRWQASGKKNRIETRETYTSGRYYYWYNTYSSPYQFVEVRCVIQDNGKVLVTGSAQFYAYTNYSSNSYNLRTEVKTVNFSKTYTSVPKTIKPTGTTTITWTGKAFKLEYKYTDKSKSYAKYRYTSSYTYGTHTTKY